MCPEQHPGWARLVQWRGDEEPEDHQPVLGRREVDQLPGHSPHPHGLPAEGPPRPGLLGGDERA